MGFQSGNNNAHKKWEVHGNGLNFRDQHALQTGRPANTLKIKHCSIFLMICSCTHVHQVLQLIRVKLYSACSIESDMWNSFLQLCRFNFDWKSFKIQFVKVVSSLLMEHMIDFRVMHIVDDQNVNCLLT